MDNLAKRITNYFSKSEAPNTDLAYNVGVLSDTKALIESGVLSYYFRKTFIVAMEVVSYSVAILLIAGGFWLFLQLQTFFHFIDSLPDNQQKVKAALNDTIRYMSYLFCFIPGVLALFWARVYTGARKKINLLKKIEKVIEKVIKNLSALAAKPSA